MQARLELLLQEVINQALPIHTVPAGKGIGDNLHMKMRAASRAPAGVSLVAGGIIPDLQSLRRQGAAQLLLDLCGHGHDGLSFLALSRLGVEAVRRCLNWSSAGPACQATSSDQFQPRASHASCSPPEPHGHVLAQQRFPRAWSHLRLPAFRGYDPDLGHQLADHEGGPYPHAALLVCLPARWPRVSDPFYGTAGHRTAEAAG